MGELISYGGDPAIIATRGEIERVQAGLATAGNLLMDQVEVTDFLTSPLKRIGLAMELPGVRERIDYLLQALDAASNEYFDGEALIAKELTDIGLVSAPVIVTGVLGLANQAGLLREHTDRVRVKEVAWFGRRAPLSLEELAVRTRLSYGAGAGGAGGLAGAGGSAASSGGVAGGRITIERFGSTFVVYIPGTQTWNPIAGANPLDFTSNMQAMKGAGLAASEVGVQLAINAALAKAKGSASAGFPGRSGTSAAEPRILLVGHSQGGMIAANIAKQDPRVKGLVTFGAPLGQLASELKLPVVALEHSNDIVPKLGLKANPMTQNMVTVVRETPIFEPNDALVEAHDLSNYVKTAEMADESQEFGLNRVRQQVLDLIQPQTGIGVEKNGVAEPGEVTVYELKRN